MWRPPTAHERMAIALCLIHALVIFVALTCGMIDMRVLGLAAFVTCCSGWLLRGFWPVVRHYLHTRHDSEAKPLYHPGVNIFALVLALVNLMINSFNLASVAS